MTQYAFNSFLVVLLAVPAVTLLSRGPKRRGLPPLLLILGLLLGAAAAGVSFWRGERLALDLSCVSPIPFALTVDRLSALFLLLICAVGAPVALFSTAYVERHYASPRPAWMWGLLPLFIASMVLVVTASTAFAFLFGWEMMTLLSAALILIARDTEQRRHDLMIYLLMMHAGAAAVFASFLLFQRQAPGLDFDSIRTVAAAMSPRMRSVIFVLAFIGFGTKAGIVPLHLWKPRSYAIAPSPVAALMSAVMLKTAIYGFVRFSFDFLGAGPVWWGYLVLAAGAVSGLLGVLYALAENDIKRLLAYSSVENVGIIYLGLGAALVFRTHDQTAWAVLALMAALFQSVNHSLFKSLLYLGAGALGDATNSLNLDRMGGLFNRMRVTGTVLLIACCCIIGLPLGNGFVSEWLTFRSFLAGSTLTKLAPATVLPLMAGVLALIGGLAAACFAKLYGGAFLGRPHSEEAEDATEVAWPMQTGMTVLAAFCVLLGVAPGILLRPLAASVHEFLPGADAPLDALAITSMLPWLALAVLFVFAAVALVRRAMRVTPTWGCGLPGLQPRMQYTATAFSKPLRRVFTSVYRPDRMLQVTPADRPYFPESISYSSVRTTSFERTLYKPAVEVVVSAANRLRQLQTGNIQVYLLYVFIALVALLVFMRFA